MLFVMGFITEEPPKIGKHLYNPADLHITYLNYAELKDTEALSSFLQKLGNITKWHEPLPVILEQAETMFGEGLDIPVRKVLSGHETAHSLLNSDIAEAVRSSDGSLIEKHSYTPHIANIGTELENVTVKHLSVIRHDGQVGVNSLNLANFTLKSS